MKHLKILGLFLLVPSIGLASGTVDLDIINYSDKDTLIVKKDNGEAITVPPGGMIKHVSFVTNSQASAYIGDKYQCTWDGIKYFDNLEPSRLDYENPYPHSFKCSVVYIQHMR